jgi:flagellar biosynthesis GTPase FlhF
MTGKIEDSGAAGVLVLILPIAFVIVILLKAWPFVLALLVLGLALRIWQHYQWKQWSQQVNPYFNQLIKENQGCVTFLDLSLKANISGPSAQRYLNKKAEEFGAQRRVLEDKGTVYYFLTASALGSIFDDSEPLEWESDFGSQESAQLMTAEEDSEPTAPEAPEELEPIAANEPSPPATQATTEEEPEASATALKTEEEPEASAAPSETEEEPETSATALETQEEPETSATALETQEEPEEEENKTSAKSEEEEDFWTDSSEKNSDNSDLLIQAELAKRLDVHSSTVGKRKSDPDFAEWSQSRDPEGIAWEYSPDTKEFMPIDLEKEKTNTDS